jgi:hypothetical protein
MCQPELTIFVDLKCIFPLILLYQPNDEWKIDLTHKRGFNTHFSTFYICTRTISHLIKDLQEEMLALLLQIILLGEEEVLEKLEIQMVRDLVEMV